MALFKISYGLASKLSNQQITEGYCWFTPDDGKFYIDHKDSNGNVVRTPLNAAVASAVAWSGITGKPQVVTGYGKGGATVPVYTNSAGELQVGTTYAGGTKVKLNNSDSYGGTTATFYAPTTAGTEGQLLVSTGGAPTWQNVSAHGTHVSYSSSNPAALGTASPGTAATVARSDHIHALPALTSCTGTLTIAKGGTGATDAATARSNLGITPDNIGAAKASHGTHVSYGTSASALGTSSAGTATTVSRSDHVHALPALTSCTGTLTVAKGGTGATDAATARTNLGITPDNIGAAKASHGTHVSYGTSAAALGTSSAGTATTVSRSDHVHALPALTSCTGTLSVAKGGTGATDAAAARTNLGITPANIGAAASSHTHSYLPLAGGTMTGKLGLLGSQYNYHSDTSSYGLHCNNSDIVGVNSIYTADNADGMSEGIHFYVDGSKWDTMTASNGTFYFSAKTAVGSSYVSDATIKAGAVYGAVWNDYAEYRETKEEIEAGRVVVENGDDTLSLATDRLMPGANIVSDTFGFAIGETENSKTPLAVSGRALAYPYEDRDSYNPGDPVCSGPNGTVSKMTREEVMMYPDRILGTVSAIPDYEVWGSGDVAVNGRIWIKVK